MKAYPKKEKKKKSKKEKYCSFQGIIAHYDDLANVPKKVKCPVCKRRLRPYIGSCITPWHMACCLWTSLDKHRRKK